MTKTTVKELLGKRKRAIRNTIIGVTLTVVGVCLYSFNQTDKKIDEIDGEEIVEELDTYKTLEEEA